MDDLQWFDKTVRRVVTEEISEEYQELVTPHPYFCDFLRYLVGATEVEMRCREAMVPEKNILLLYTTEQGLGWGKIYRKSKM